jgi:PAS domain S-box-containing protein
MAPDILVIDDEVDQLRLMTEVLTRAGYRVRSAEEPLLGLESALAYPPGLILLDVMMPGMDGFELCRRLQEHEPTLGVPVIFLSALDETEQRVRGFDAGGVDYISKPYQKLEVLARVKTHLQLREMRLRMEELVAERTADLEETNQALEEEIRTRARAEHAVVESERKYRAVVEGASEGILIVQDGGRVYYNPTWLEMIGYTAEEYEPLPFLSLVHPDDLETLEDSYRDLLEGQEFGALPDFRIVTKSGDTRWLALHGSRIDWESRPAGMVFIQDITERKRAEERLRESEERFRLAFENAQDAILWADPETGMIVNCNAATERLLEKSKDEIVGTRQTTLHPPEKTAYYADLFKRHFEQRRALGDEAEVITKSGEIKPISIAACTTVIGEQLIVQGIFRDITERKRATEVLRQREATLEAVAYAAESFLEALDWQDEMDAILDRLGTATGVSRVYVFQNHAGSQGEILTSQRFEWCSAGIPPQIDNPDLQDFPLRARGFGRWEETLGRGDVIHGHLRAFPESERQVLAVQDIQSLVVVPVFVGGQWWGFIGFDECKAEKEWSFPERDALRAAANTLGTAIERRQTVLALRESEERFRATFEQAAVGIAQVTPEGRFVRVNQRLCDMVGYSQDELLAQTFQDIAHPHDVEVGLKLARRLLAGEIETLSLETRYQHKNSEIVWVSLTAALVRKDAGDPGYFVAVFEDITERVKVRQELRSSQRLLSLVIDHVPAQVAYVDKCQRYRFVNQRYEQAYQIPRSQFVGQRVRQVLGLEGYAAAEPHIAAALSGDEVSYVEVFRYPDAGQRWMRIEYVPDTDHGGDVQGFVAMLSDITEDKRAEENLTTSNRRLEEAQAIAQIGDWEHNILVGEITWSDEMYRIFGVDQREYVPTDKSDREFCYPEDRPVVRSAFERFFASGEDLDIDYRIVTPQGERKACRLRGRLVLDERGIPCLARGTIEDITERKWAEQQVQEYQRRLQALASLLTLSEEQERRRIARELHDEIGQALAFARMRLASAREATSETKREAILDDVSQSLRQTIGDLRDLIFDLSSPLLDELGLAAALAEWLDERVGRKYGLVTEFVHDGQGLLLDDDLTAILFRSTRELLANVIKHAQARHVIVHLDEEETLVRIVVQDDGIGFDVDTIQMTMDRSGGFGLFSIRERMADLGGSLEIASEPGQGCTAILTVPTTTG